MLSEAGRVCAKDNGAADSQRRKSDRTGEMSMRHLLTRVDHSPKKQTRAGRYVLNRKEERVIDSHHDRWAWSGMLDPRRNTWRYDHDGRACRFRSLLIQAKPRLMKNLA